MSTSVIITAFNEGIDLEGTVMDAIGGSVRPDEVIVVDDGSDTPIAPRFDGPPWQGIVRVAKTPSRRGCAASRNYGVSQSADTDLIAILDSHMRMPHWWLEAAEDAVRKHPNAIFCAACADFSTNWTSTFHAAGAGFKTEFVQPDPVWLEPGLADAIDTVPCLLGAAYFIPRRIWQALHGLNPNFHGWGMDEQDLSLRAWQLGFEVRRINRLIIAHRFRRTTGFHDHSGWPRGYNAVVFCSTVFEDGVYEERYEPFLRDVYRDAKTWSRWYSERESIENFRAITQRARVRSDDEVERIIGPVRHTLEQQLALRAKQNPPATAGPTTKMEPVPWRNATPILP